MSNKCFTVLVENCRCVHPLEWDHAEELITTLGAVGGIAEVGGLRKNSPSVGGRRFVSF